MSGSPIDRAQIKRANVDRELMTRLAGERALSLMAIIVALVCGILLFYVSYGRERLERVYIDQDRYDAPVLLEKIRDSDDRVLADRWVRGFVNRFVKYYFIHPDDPSAFVRKALAWLHAHTGPEGRHRSLSLWNDFEKYDGARKIKYSSFFEKLDAEIKIRQSEQDSRLLFVELPGTYVTKTEQGESFHDARLKLVVQKTAASGIPSDLGEINIVGLTVVDGSIEFVADYTRPGELTNHPIFQKTE